MENLYSYAKILDKYDISELLQHSEIDLKNYLMENIAKIIYYSSKIEGNNLDEDTSNLILNGVLIPKGGTLQDYIEISNHGRAYEKLIQMSHKEINLDDVIGLRKTLLEDIIGDGKYEGFRRFTIVSEFNKGTAEQVPVELQKFLAILNTRPINTIDAFLNAVKFHALFEELHPFEDGNGRTGRLLMNLYLMKSRLSPILITQSDRNIYVSGLRSHHAGYYGGLIYQMLFLSLDEEKRNILLERLGSINEKDPREIEFRDIIYSLQSRFKMAGKIEKIKGDIVWLYNLKKNDKNMALAALHIAGLNKIDSDIISNALSDADSDIRALAIETAWEVWSDKYISYFVEIGLNDKYFLNRARALLTLSLKGAIESKFLSEVLTQEKDETVLSLFFSKIAYSKKIDNLIANTDSIKKELESNSDSVKSAAYDVLMRYGTNTEIIKTTEELVKSRDLLVIEKSIFSLFWFAKIDIDQIVEIMISLSKENKLIKDTMLGLFDAFSKYPNIKINNRYNEFLDEIIQYGNNTERAYAYYVLSGIVGPNYLSKKYGFEINEKNSVLENISLMLTKKPQHRINDAIELLNINDNRLNVIGAVEINRFLYDKKFNETFLSLYLKELRRW